MEKLCFRHRRLYKKAKDLGINFFDTADIYSQGLSEKLLGKLTRTVFKREDLIISTKVGQPMGSQGGLSKSYLKYAIEASLKRLNTDYVDLYIIHRWDYNTPIEETLENLDDIVKQGKVRYLGASSLFAWQFCKILETNKSLNYHQFITMQNHYNLVYREEEREMLPLCKEYNISVTPYSPLARGFLTDRKKTNRYKNDTIAKKYYNSKDDYKVLEATKQVAEELGVSSAEVAISWLLQKKEIKSVILGPRKVEHINQLVSKQPVSLSKNQINTIEKYYKPKNIAGHK